MPAVHLQQRRPCGNQPPRLVQLGERAEGIARPTDEERGHAEDRKVGDAKIAGAPGRMQRIGLKQQAASRRSSSRAVPPLEWASRIAMVHLQRRQALLDSRQRRRSRIARAVD
jgi:hypothetical protein